MLSGLLTGSLTGPLTGSLSSGSPGRIGIFLDWPLTTSLALNKGSGLPTHVRNTVATYLDSSSVYQEALANVAAFEADGNLFSPGSTNKVECYSTPGADQLGGELWANPPTSLDTGWVDNLDDTYTCDGSQVANSNLLVVATIPLGTVYNCLVTVSGITAGAVRVFPGNNGGLDGSAWFSTNGSHSAILDMLNGAETQVNVQADPDFIGTVSLISFKEIGGTNSVTSAFVSGLGTDVQATTAYNPIPGMTVDPGSDAGAVLSIVDDQTALEAFGELDVLASHWKCFDLTTGAGGAGDVDISGAMAAVTTSMGVFARLLAGSAVMSDDNGANSVAIAGAAYSRITEEDFTATANTLTRLTASASSQIRFLIPTNEDLAFATNPIITNGAATIRNKTELSLQTAGNLPSSGTRHIKFDWTPKGIDSGTAQCLWATRDDATNYMAMWADGVDVWFEKVVAGASEVALLAVAASAGTTYQIDAFINADNTLNLYVDDVVDDTNTSTTLAPAYGTTMEYGSLNGVSNAFCNFANHIINNSQLVV